MWLKAKIKMTQERVHEFADTSIEMKDRKERPLRGPSVACKMLGRSTEYVTGAPEKGRKEQRKRIRRNNGQELTKVNERYKITDSKISANTKQNQHKENLIQAHIDQTAVFL